MKRSKLLQLFVALLTLGQLFLASTPVRAEDMTCPEHTPVSIDIKPGSYPNSINLDSKGVVAVAVLTTDNFDASLFTPEMAHLFDSALINESCENATFVRWVREDVDGDKRLDIVFFFDAQKLTLTTATTNATLMAHGSFNGAVLHIKGSDSVKVKG